MAQRDTRGWVDGRSVGAQGSGHLLSNALQHPCRQRGLLAWDKDMDPHCSMEMKYCGGIGDYTAPWHHLELADIALVQWWN